MLSPISMRANAPVHTMMPTKIIMNAEWKPPSIRVSTPTKPRRRFENQLSGFVPKTDEIEISPLTSISAAELKQEIIAIAQIRPAAPAIRTGSLLLLQIEKTITKRAISRQRAKKTTKAMSLPLIGSRASGQVNEPEKLSNIDE